MSLSGDKARADLTRMLSGVASVASAVRNQARSDIQARVERVINRMDLVKRSELDELETLLQQARQRQEELEARIARLEAATPPSKASNAKSGTKSGSGQSKTGGSKSGAKNTTSRKTAKSRGKSGINTKSS